MDSASGTGAFLGRDLTELRRKLQLFMQTFQTDSNISGFHLSRLQIIHGAKRGNLGEDTRPGGEIFRGDFSKVSCHRPSDERRKEPGVEPTALAGSRLVLLDGQEPHSRNRLGSGEERDEAGGGESTWGRSPRHAHALREFVCVGHRERLGVPVRSEEKGKKRGQERCSRACQGLRGRPPGCAETTGPGATSQAAHPRHRARPGQPPAYTVVSGQRQGRGRTRVFAPLRRGPLLKVEVTTVGSVVSGTQGGCVISERLPLHRQEY